MTSGEVQAVMNSGLCGLIYRLNLSVHVMNKNKLSVERICNICLFCISLSVIFIRAFFFFKLMYFKPRQHEQFLCGKFYLPVYMMKIDQFSVTTVFAENWRVSFMWRI